MKRGPFLTQQRGIWEKGNFRFLSLQKLFPWAWTSLSEESFSAAWFPANVAFYSPYFPRIRFLAAGFAGLVLLTGLSLAGAAEGQPSKPPAKDSPQITGPGHIDFIKPTSPPKPSKDAQDFRERHGPTGDRSPRPPYRYYYYYYGPYWPGYPWPYPPPPPPVYIPYGPIFVDPDAAGYGPRSVLRLMGVEHWFSAPPSSQQDSSSRPLAPNRVGNLGAGPLGDQAPAPKAPNQPNLNPPLVLEGREKEGPPGGNNVPDAGQNPQRAMLLVDFGDAHFANKKYADALGRYREAARLDPQLPEAHLHMGFALAALGKYAEAAQAFKQALRLDPNWPASGFRLSVLYGPQEAERVAHRNALAGAAAAKPNDPDLLFLLGIMFYFDQMRDQARRSFLEAARLAAPNTAHIDPFLRRL